MNDPVDVDGILYFTALDPTNGAELWKSDGTPGGTNLVKDINPGSADSFPGDTTNVGGTLYFHANDGTIGYELWALDPTPPETTIDSGPSGTITTDEATFTFSSTEAGSSFECEIDEAGFSPCSSPATYPGLVNGPHTFTVMATDTAGNTDPSPATREFTVAATVYKARVGKVKVSGPKKVKKGKKATYKVKVTNSGNATATGVRLKVKGRGLSFNTSVGKIAAGKTRTVKVKVKPKKPGKVKATFKVTSAKAGGRTVTKAIKVKK